MTVNVKPMYKKTLYLFTLLIITNPLYAAEGAYVGNFTDSYIAEDSTTTLSSKSFSLEERSVNKFVNEIFKDNILLTLNYMDGRIKTKSDIVWEDVTKPRSYQFELKPQETFAFHDQILEGYDNNGVKTTNAHFNYQDGFKSSGYLFGDGVCHLASLLYWASLDAGLTVHSPTDHDFAKINEVPKEYGVSIYYMPGGFEKSARQNLYITNNLDTPVSFIFSYDGKVLSVDVTKFKS